jgi:hypothetical protein
MRYRWAILIGVWTLTLSSGRAADPDGPRLGKPMPLQAAKKPISVDESYTAPFYADIDGSRKPAVLVGQFDGTLRIYKNHGTLKEPRFEDFTLLQAGGQVAQVFTH